MKYFKLFLKEKKLKLIITLLMLLGQVVGTLLVPYLIANIIDEGILQNDLSQILHIGVQMLVVVFLTTLISVLGGYYSADLGALLGHDMRDKIFKKSQELSIHEFDAIGVSSMITRTTSDISSLQQSLGLALQLIVPAPLIIMASIVMAAQISLPLAIIQIIFVLLFVIFSYYVLKKSNHLSKRIQRRLDRINQVIRESITGIRVIRAYGNEKYEENRARDAYEQYATNMIDLNKLFAVLNPAVWLMIGLAMALLVWFGGLLSMKGSMQVGEITAVIEYTIITMSYLILATTSSVTLPKMRSCLDRLEEVLDIEPTIKDLCDTSDTVKGNAPVLEFDKVSFSYNQAEEQALEDLSFCCYPGQTTAIIGSTGSGKSTIANLILRLYDVEQGNIRLNGMDIRTIPQQLLRDSIGYVPQKSFLFSGTIADNLRMGNEQATMADMTRALSIAQADSFVNNLEQGIDAPVSQGGINFSGGQKQRLSMARALVRKAPIYIFDDSFSALDLKTDALLRKALKDHMTDAVKIIIAQRVSTIMDADQILVLEEGRLVGIGTHENLMNTCAVYQAIAKSQNTGKEA